MWKIKEIFRVFLYLAKPALKLHAISVRSLMAEIPHRLGCGGEKENPWLILVVSLG
jgi:hypothetical protein